MVQDTEVQDDVERPELEEGRAQDVELIEREVRCDVLQHVAQPVAADAVEVLDPATGEYRAVYVGKTYVSVEGRFNRGHLSEVSDTRKAAWIELAEETERLRSINPNTRPLIRSTPIENGTWNNAETAVWEQHSINRMNRTLSADQQLVNRAVPMSTERFNELRRTNPALFSELCR